MSNITLTSSVMPVVALRGLVVFPGMHLHFDVSRPQSVAALKAAMADNQEVFLVTQRDALEEEPEVSGLFKTGVTAIVKQVLKLPSSENIRVIVEGTARGQLTELIKKTPYYSGIVRRRRDFKVLPENREYEQALVRKAKEIFTDYLTEVPPMPAELGLTIVSETHAGKIADIIAGNIVMETEDRQSILDELNTLKRLEKLCVLLAKESDILKLENDINDRVREQIDDHQHEYFLREQIKAINDELGDNSASEVEGFREKIMTLGLDEESEKKLLTECDRLERAPDSSPDAAVLRTYIETCLSLPWNSETADRLDIAKARKILDADHYGMEKVKERILETLAVRKLAPDIKGQILCLVGPPGVGKTSVAKSVARAMGRKYVRISLGGVRDEAEIRGHRKTYIGSMPGRIISAIKNAGTKNPLMLLDEVDKLGNDYKGDPSSALLEVLDGEQNFSFRDHYIELPFDLSKVFFITTANDSSAIPAPLLDRMEVIELGSYTHEEKFNIAKNHLLPKQAKRHGLDRRMFKVSDDALRAIIDGYTREAGVRKLEREIAHICRKAAVRTVSGEKRIKVGAHDLEELIGPVKYKPDVPLDFNDAGVVNGLAWTSVGGEMLKVEAAVVDGTGKLELTGSLGDVMKESAKAAVTCIRSRADALGIDKSFYKEKDIHIHVPEGATPKDGPSAGVTIATALLSALSRVPAKGDVAMTGELTLLGRVLPIGGLREKTMAAYRSGVKTVIIPEENAPDLAEVDAAVKENVEFVTVKTVDEVFSAALAHPVLEGGGKAKNQLPVSVLADTPPTIGITQ